MRVTIKMGPFNPNRYGKPWIAKVVSWSVGRAYALEFGRYIGDRSGGEVEIDAGAGDVVRFGQKDLRWPDRSVRAWGVVESDGSVTEVDMTAAREAWLVKRAAKRQRGRKRESVQRPAG